LDSSDKVAYQKYTKGDKVKFDILKPGEYIVRILVDNNENKYWDEADFANETFAEDAYVFYKKAGKRIMGNKRRMGSERYKNIDNPKGTASASTVPAACF
jgi:hypothetical protein